MATVDQTHRVVQEPPVSERSDRAHRLAVSLARYYASISELATALDTTRDTIRSWLTSPPRKPRQDLLLRAERLWLLGRAAQRYMVGLRQVGAWTLAPHLGLNGTAPADVLLTAGDDGLRRLLADMTAYTPSRRDLNIEDDDQLIWEGVQAMLGPELLDHVQRVLDAPEQDVTDEDLAELNAFD